MALIYREQDADLPAYRDPAHPGNGPEHHTGKPCIEKGCSEPAGTAWSPLWCIAHNVERMDRIGQQLASFVRPIPWRDQ